MKPVLRVSMCHKRNSIFYDEEICIFKNIIDMLLTRETYIKVHSRYATTMIEEYADKDKKH